jgi:hypothetical protein
MGRITREKTGKNYHERGGWAGWGTVGKQAQKEMKEQPFKNCLIISRKENELLIKFVHRWFSFIHTPLIIYNLILRFRYSRVNRRDNGPYCKREWQIICTQNCLSL